MHCFTEQVAGIDCGGIGNERCSSAADSASPEKFCEIGDSGTLLLREGIFDLDTFRGGSEGTVTLVCTSKGHAYYFGVVGVASVVIASSSSRHQIVFFQRLGSHFSFRPPSDYFH